jgi:hypothetical protein
MGRYYEADKTVTDIMTDLIFTENRFPNLKAANIKVVMDSKPKVDKLTETVTFASIKLANEVEKYLSKDGHNITGIDYIIFVNDIVWELADAQNKKRILSHELRHTYTDDKGNYKVVKHDLEDFYAEVEINKADPMWAQSLGLIALAKIDQMKEEAKANK